MVLGRLVDGGIRALVGNLATPRVPRVQTLNNSVQRKTRANYTIWLCD
jgi:hypothetical protein